MGNNAFHDLALQSDQKFENFNAMERMASSQALSPFLNIFDSSDEDFQRFLKNNEWSAEEKRLFLESMCDLSMGNTPFMLALKTGKISLANRFFTMMQAMDPDGVTGEKVLGTCDDRGNYPLSVACMTRLTDSALFRKMIDISPDYVFNSSEKMARAGNSDKNHERYVRLADLYRDNFELLHPAANRQFSEDTLSSRRLFVWKMRGDGFFPGMIADSQGISPVIDGR